MLNGFMVGYGILNALRDLLVVEFGFGFSICSSSLSSFIAEAMRSPGRVQDGWFMPLLLGVVVWNS